MHPSMFVKNICLILLVVLSACSSPLATTKCSTVLNPKFRVNDKAPYTLIISSGAGCPYSGLALKDLKNYFNPNLSIRVLERGTSEAIDELHSQYFDDYQFVDGESCKGYQNKFYPRYFLYKGNKLIWKQKGYEKQVSKKLDSLIVMP